MIEMMIVAMIFAHVVKRGAEDVIHTAMGGTPPRRAAAAQRRKSGAAGRYWGQLWDDTWSDLLTKHNDRRSPAASSRPRGAARVFLSNWWRDGWLAAERRRSSKATRPRPGQQTVPGTVVPNAQDGDEDRPEDGDRPVPTSVLDEDGDGTDLQDGTVIPEQDQDEDEQDDSGPESGPDEGGPADKWQVVLPNGQAVITDDPENYRAAGYPVQPVRGYDRANGFDITDYPTPATPTTEGPTMTTMPTGEVTGLSDMINFCESSTVAFKAQIHATELSIAAAAAGGVTGPGAAKLAHAMELCTAAAAAYDEAAVEYKSHVVVQEAYDAVPGAGTREFVTAGR